MIGVPLLWLTVINVALWTGLASSIISGEREWSTLRVEHGWAWCVWPTVVHVDDLRIAVDGPNVQLELEFDHADADIELRQLFARRFDANWVEAQGAHMVLAFKKPHGTPTSALVGFREIDGLGPAIQAAQPPTPPAADKAWELELRDIKAQVDRVQLDAMDAVVDGQMSGQLSFKVAHRLAVPRARLELADAKVTRADKPVARDVQGHLEAQIAEFNPIEIAGRPALRFVSGELSIRGANDDLDWVADIPEPPPFTLARGAGVFWAQANIEAGTFSADSEAHFQSDDLGVSKTLEASAMSWRTRVELDLVARRVPNAATPQGRVELALREVRSLVSGHSEAWMTAPKLTAALSMSQADLVKAPGSVRLHGLQVEELDIDRLAALDPFIEGFAIYGGTLAGRVSATSDDLAKGAKLEFAFDTDGLRGAKGETNLETSGYLRGEGHIDFDESFVRLEPLNAKLRGLRLDTTRGETSRDWVDMNGAKLTYEVPSRRLALDATGRISSLRALLAHLRRGDDIYERVPNVGIGTKAVDYRLEFRGQPGRLRLDVTRLVGGPVDAEAAVSRVGDDFRSVVYLRRGKMGMTSTGGGRRDWQVAVGKDWFSRKRSWVFAQVDG